MPLTPITSWSLQSPNGQNWQAMMSDAGIVTWNTIGAPLTATAPVYQGPGTVIWTPSIDNNGIETIAQGVAAGQLWASLISPLGTTWLAYVTSLEIIRWRQNLYPVNASMIMIGVGGSIGSPPPFPPPGGGLPPPPPSLPGPGVSPVQESGQIGEGCTVTAWAHSEGAQEICHVIGQTANDLITIADDGTLTMQTGGSVDDVFYLQSPNGTPWRVTVDHTTGAMTWLPDVPLGVPLGRIERP